MTNREGPTPRTTVRRHGERGCYDRETIYRIIDEALVCHVGFVSDGQPMVIPTIPTRLDDRLYIHGAMNSHTLGVLASGASACITVTLVDGLVLARSALHHSMNYRSVVVLGKGADVTDHAEKARVLYALMADIVPGRTADLPEMGEADIKATRVVGFPLEEASAKVRSGPPIDRDRDKNLPVWGGVLPLTLQAGTPLPDDLTPSGSDVPHYLTNYTRQA